MKMYLYGTSKRDIYWNERSKNDPLVGVVKPLEQIGSVVSKQENSQFHFLPIYAMLSIRAKEQRRARM